MNSNLNDTVLKLESCIQQYEYVLHETEQLIKIIVKLFSKFTNKLINDIMDYNQDNERIREILGYFSLLVFGSNTVTQVKI